MNKVRLAERRKLATIREQARARRTPRQQLDVLDKRLGLNKGAEKERAKLKEQLKDARLTTSSKGQ